MIESLWILGFSVFNMDNLKKAALIIQRDNYWRTKINLEFRVQNKCLGFKKV